MAVTTYRAPDRRLRDVVTRIGQRDGAQTPSREAVDRAVQLMDCRSTSMNVCPARVYHVTDDGRRHMVAVYDGLTSVLDAECSCGSGDVCAHLLAVLAKHDLELDTGK